MANQIDLQGKLSREANINVRTQLEITMKNLIWPLPQAFRLLAFVCPILLNAQTASQNATGNIIAYDLENDYASPQHQIYTINADGTGNAKLITASIGFNHLEYSPDGKKLPPSAIWTTLTRPGQFIYTIWQAGL